MTKQFLLFDKNIDKTKTAKRTRRFFLYDLDKYLSISGMHSDDVLAPSKINIQYEHEDTSNSYITYMISSQILIKCCALALKDIKDYTRRPIKTVLVETFINHLPSYEVATKLGYSEASCREFKREGLNLFALRFIHYQLNNNIVNPLDLCVYSK